MHTVCRCALIERDRKKVNSKTEVSVVNKGKSSRVQVSAIITFIVILSAAVNAGARAFPAPSWSGDDGTTFQQWSFSKRHCGPQLPDAGWVNEFGTPQLSVYDSTWSNKVDGHKGVWKFNSLSSEMIIDIPNSPESRLVKEIWVELTWEAADTRNCVPWWKAAYNRNCIPWWEAAGTRNHIPDQPIIGVWADHFEKELMGEKQIDNKWTASLYKITIWPNPSAEQITINGDIRLDKVVVDTICIPEPATLGLLIGGALMAIRRRRKV
jgi:hypothetical protein